MKGGWVYITTNKNNTAVYVGMTSNLMRRVLQHKRGEYPGSFTDRYLCHKLVWYAHYPMITEVIKMEKRIKHWQRPWKDELIGKENPDWKDLSEGWYHPRDLE